MAITEYCFNDGYGKIVLEPDSEYEYFLYKNKQDSGQGFLRVKGDKTEFFDCYKNCWTDYGQILDMKIKEKQFEITKIEKITKLILPSRDKMLEEQGLVDALCVNVSNNGDKLELSSPFMGTINKEINKNEITRYKIDDKTYCFKCQNGNNLLFFLCRNA